MTSCFHCCGRLITPVVVDLLPSTVYATSCYSLIKTTKFIDYNSPKVRKDTVLSFLLTILILTCINVLFLLVLIYMFPVRLPFLTLCQVFYPTNLSFLFIYSMGAQPVSNIYTQLLYCEHASHTENSQFILLFQKSLDHVWRTQRWESKFCGHRPFQNIEKWPFKLKNLNLRRHHPLKIFLKHML